MFLLDGKPLALDVPFATADGTQYDADWLGQSTEKEREDIGIVEIPNPPINDQRFYWISAKDGSSTPKDHGELVKLWTEQTRTTANTLIAPTDWLIIREADNKTPAPIEFKAYRQVIRDKCGEKVNIIQGTATTDELAIYIVHGNYSTWFNTVDTSSNDESTDDTVVDDTVI
jgi:hypothetical protein